MLATSGRERIVGLIHLGLSRKLIAAFGLLIVAAAAMSGIYTWCSTTVLTESARERSARLQLMAVNQMALTLTGQQNALRGFILTGTPRFVDDYDRERAALSAAFAQFHAAEADPVQAARIDTVAAIAREWQVTSADKQIAAARDPATRSTALQYVTGQSFTRMRAGLAEVVADKEAAADQAHAAMGRANSLAVIATVVGGVVLVVLAGLLGWLLTQSVARPALVLATAMRRLADGDLEVALPAPGRRDEIGQMGDALHVLRDAARQTRSLAAAAAEARAVHEAERDRAAAERDETARATARVVAGVTGGMERLAGGDLTVRLPDPFRPEYEGLRTDFNAAAERLQATMRVIVTNTQGLQSGTGEITQAADDLSRRTEQQAASLEQTAAALDGIVATVRRTAAGAKEAQAAVASAREDAERSGTVVQDAVGAMSAIEDSAREISQIIGVIDEIAFQTNLLALNAGVEAARAGDAGRGFAVVASEVRALAQRSADAAKQIKSLIQTSSRQVSRGVELVGETGRSLGRIAGQVIEVSGLVSQIAASAAEQATGLAEVNVAVTEMDQMTQQNAAMVEQSTAASHSLSRDAAELAQLTGRFTIGEASAGMQPLRRPARAAATPAAVPVPGRRRAAGRGAVLADTDGWTEF